MEAVSLDTHPHIQLAEDDEALRDLIDFAFNIPLSLKINQNIYRFAFAMRFPELAQIPRQGTNLAIDTSDLRLNLYHLESRLINRSKKTRLK